MLLNFVRFNPIKKKKGEANLTNELTCKHCKKKKANKKQKTRKQKKKPIKKRNK